MQVRSPETVPKIVPSTSRSSWTNRSEDRSRLSAVPPAPTQRAAVVVALPLILKVESKVDEAVMNRPAVVEVGVRVGWPAKAMWKAPGSPVDAPAVLSSAAQVTLPEPSTVRVPPLESPEQL